MRGEEVRFIIVHLEGHHLANTHECMFDTIKKWTLTTFIALGRNINSPIFAELFKLLQKYQNFTVHKDFCIFFPLLL